MTTIEPRQDPAAVRPPPTLTAEEFGAEHRRPRPAPRRRYGRAARSLFFVLDLSYGRPRTLAKFTVLQLAARVRDHEPWQLRLLQERVERQGEGQRSVRLRALPRLLALAYHDASWLLHAVRPSCRHGLDSDIHDYAEHELALFVQERPGVEAADGRIVRGHGRFESVAVPLRRMAQDDPVSDAEARSA